MSEDAATTSRRRGRRPGKSATRGAILDAAREEFAAQGYDRARIRAIAARAGVDPALVHHFFGTKDALFAAAMELPVNPGAIIAPVLAEGLEGAGERIVRRVLEVWGDAAARQPLLAMVHSVSSRPEVAETLRRFIEHEVRDRIAAVLAAPDAPLRATLAGSQVVGLVVARYVLRVEPLASADPERLVAAVGPALQRYLTGDL